MILDYLICRLEAYENVNLPECAKQLIDHPQLMGWTVVVDDNVSLVDTRMKIFLVNNNSIHRALYDLAESYNATLYINENSRSIYILANPYLNKLYSGDMYSGHTYYDPYDTSMGNSAVDGRLAMILQRINSTSTLLSKLEQDASDWRLSGYVHSSQPTVSVNRIDTAIDENGRMMEQWSSDLFASILELLNLLGMKKQTEALQQVISNMDTAAQDDIRNYLSLHQTYTYAKDDLLHHLKLQGIIKDNINLLNMLEYPREQE